MDKDKKIKELNKDNEWLKFLQTGESPEPYLSQKKIKVKKPKYVSNRQRRIFKKI